MGMKHRCRLLFWLRGHGAPVLICNITRNGLSATGVGVEAGWNGLLLEASAAAIVSLTRPGTQEGGGDVHLLVQFWKASAGRDGPQQELLISPGPLEVGVHAAQMLLAAGVWDHILP